MCQLELKRSENVSKFDDVGKEGTLFCKNFMHLKEKRIVLYGTGRLTQRLLPMILGKFNIVGLMDGREELSGKTVYGFPVIGLEEAENIADVIIINTAEIYWQIIYDRIWKSKIPVYYRDGSRADEKAGADEIESFYQQYRKAVLQDGNGNWEERIMKLIGTKFFQEICPDYVYGKPIIYKKIKDYGYCVYGPVVYSFLCWLLVKAKELDINELLFIARDGYLLIDEYKEFVKKFQITNAPRAEYLAGSRRMILVAGIHDRKSFEEVMSHSYSGTFYEYMKTRFSLDISEIECGKECIVLPKDREKVLELMKPYMLLVEEEIREERKDYLQYLCKKNISENSGVVDTGFSGRIPFYLSELLGNKQLKTFYWYGDLTDENKYNVRKNIYACFQSAEDTAAEKCQLEKHRILNESIFTAPHGMMQKFKGKNICYLEENSCFEINEEIDQGIKQFMCDMRQTSSFDFSGKNEEYKENIKLEEEGLKAQALWVDSLFGKIVKSTKLKKEFQEKMSYRDGWFGAL